MPRVLHTAEVTIYTVASILREFIISILVGSLGVRNLLWPPLSASSREVILGSDSGRNSKAGE